MTSKSILGVITRHHKIPPSKPFSIPAYSMQELEPILHIVKGGVLDRSPVYHRTNTCLNIQANTVKPELTVFHSSNPPKQCFVLFCRNWNANWTHICDNGSFWRRCAYIFTSSETWCLDACQEHHHWMCERELHTSFSLPN